MVHCQVEGKPEEVELPEEIVEETVVEVTNFGLAHV